VRPSSEPRSSVIRSSADTRYGKTPAERDLIPHHFAMVEPLLRASCTHELDASRSLDDVVADVIAIAEGA
jgi:hypothetical protein